MAEVSSFIVDSSVAVKWFLKLGDEPYLDQADLVLQDYQADRIRLLAPIHIYCEAGHALRRAVLRERIEWQRGQTALERFLALRIPTVHEDALILQGWSLSRAYGCSFYDSVYLALSQIAQCPFVHADDKLRRNLGRRLSSALWIEDCRSPRRVE